MNTRTTLGVPLLPPRPNPGPEPWPEERNASGWALGVTLAILMVAILLAWRLRRRKRHGPAAAREASPAAAPAPEPDRLLAAAETARGTLVAHLGPEWAARTTEEIAGDRGLQAQIGSGLLAQLLELLLRADRVKFAGAPSPTAHGEDWEDWLGAFSAALAAGANSTSNGR